MRDDTGTHGEPIYYGSGKPASAADLTEIAGYAAKVGNVRVGPISQRNALAGTDLWNGLRWVSTDDGSESIWFITAGWTPFPINSGTQTGGMFSTASGWSVVKQNWITIGAWAVNFYITVQRTGGNISVPVDGNLTNVTVASGNTGFRPEMATPVASGSEGRVASLVYNTDGQLRLTAIPNGGNSTLNISTGDQFSGGGFVVLAS